MTTTDSPVRLDLEPVSGALGAEVHGLDLANLSDGEFTAVRAALLEHLVLFFPDQHLTPDAHRAFAARWGELEIHPLIPKLDDEHPEIVVLDGDRGARADVWHTDVTFSESPPICSILNMVRCPIRGGDTMWTNQYLVYESLSAPLRDLLDGLTARHAARAFGRPDITAYAVNDYDEPRLIQRVTVLGDRPRGGEPRWPAWEPAGVSAAVGYYRDR